MPEVKISKKQKTAKERLREMRDQRKGKKTNKKSTLADLEARLDVLEDAVFESEET